MSTVKLDFVHSLCRILKCGTCDCTSLKSYLLRDTQLVNCEYLGGVYIRLPRSRVSDKFFDKICFRLYERRASILWRDLAIDYRDLSLESCKFPNALLLGLVLPRGLVPLHVNIPLVFPDYIRHNLFENDHTATSYTGSLLWVRSSIIQFEKIRE